MCIECDQAKQKRYHGIYRMDCLECCVRLVNSTRPCKVKANAMLAAIERLGGFKRQEILEALKK